MEAGKIRDRTLLQLQRARHWFLCLYLPGSLTSFHFSWRDIEALGSSTPTAVLDSESVSLTVPSDIWSPFKTVKSTQYCT